MIGYLEGKIIFKDDKNIILLRNGIGFEVFLSITNLKKVKEGDDLKIYTFVFMGEKILEMYGFLSINEFELFKVLVHVQGIGPKTAINLAGAGSLEKLKSGLEKGEVPEGAKGLGAKRIQKILLELTGKIKEIKKERGGDGDVTIALKALGFSLQDIKKALAEIPVNVEDAEERIKMALKLLQK